MDPWDWHALMYARNSESIRRWADLESKSSTTSDELYQSQLPPRAQRTKLLGMLALSGKLIAALVQAWLTRSR